MKQEYRGFPERSRDVVISTCAADDVSFSFVFCRDSCTPPGPDGPGRIPHGPNNEKKKKNQNRNLSEESDPFCNLNARRKKRRKMKESGNKVRERNKREEHKKKKELSSSYGVPSVTGVQSYTTLSSVLRKRYQQREESGFPG